MAAPIPGQGQGGSEGPAESRLPAPAPDPGGMGCSSGDRSPTPGDRRTTAVQRNHGIGSARSPRASPHTPCPRAGRWQLRLYFVLSGALLVLSPLLFTLIQPTPAPLAALAWCSIAYAVLLLVLPLLRLAVVGHRNRRIEARNRQRQSWWHANPRHRQLLESKRAFARRFSRRIRLGPLPLAYTTERDLLDQRLQP